MNTCEKCGIPFDKIDSLEYQVDQMNKENSILHNTVSKNEFGLDVHYIQKRLIRVLQSVDSYTPDEMFRELTNMAAVARLAGLTDVKELTE
jgi:hypothetical protein